MCKVFKFIFLMCLFGSLSGCFKGKSVDLIIHNAHIHTLNDKEDVFEAIAIKDGKIIEAGPERQILNRYRSKDEIDAGGKDIYPGFTDSYGHIIDFAKRKLCVDLTGTRSYDELLVRLEKHDQLNTNSFIIGQGLDTSLWNSKEKLTNGRLNKLFPKKFVCLYLLGEESVMTNNEFLRKSKLENINGFVTGNSLNFVSDFLPPYSKNVLKKSILEIQNELFQYGITGVHEVDLEFESLNVFKDLVKSNQFYLNVYGILAPTEKNIEFAKKHKKYKFKNLTVRSFHANSKISMEELKRLALVCESSGYQLSVDCLNSKNNTFIFDIFSTINNVNKDHRWRLENAQNLTPKEYIQSVQLGVFHTIVPNQAITDFSNFSFKSVLNQSGMVSIGSNFPIQKFNPFLTIHISSQGLNSDNSILKGIISKELLTLNECIKGITTWSSYASFEEKNIGTLEKGKDATLVLFEFPVATSQTFRQNYAFMTFIKGKKVYSIE